MDLEKDWRTTIRQDYYTYCQAWRRKSYGLGLYGMEWDGVLTEVEGKMGAKQYVEILDGEVLDSLEKLGLDRETFYFQQDNDPKHTSKLASKFFNN